MTKINIDMDKAKEIHKDNLRQVRDPIMKQLDIDFMKAVETNDKKAIDEIARKKKELRDITKHTKIENAKTPEQLKAFWPDILNS